MSIKYAVPDEERVDLAEFVSDYMRMARETDGPGASVSNHEIADQYLDTFGRPGLSKDQCRAEIEELASQIAYYTEKED